MAKKYGFSRVLGVLGGLSFTCAAWAADPVSHERAVAAPVPAASAPVATASPVFLLDPVVVTATRVETPLSQTSQAVTIIGQEELVQRQNTDILEELRQVPGFTIIQTGSRGGTTSLLTRGGESDYNLVLVDGVKANRAGGFFDFDDVTTLGLERIEILRGPHSALYGSDAISSVIQLFTPRGQGPARGFVRFRAGSYKTFEERAGISGGTQRYGYNLSIGRVDSGGILSKNNDYSNTTLASRFDFDPTEQLQLTSTLRYLDSRFHFPTESSGDRFGPLDPHQYSDNRRFILGPRIVYTLTTWWQQRLQLGLLYDRRTFRDPVDEGVDSRSFVSNTYERRLSADYASTFFLPAVGQIQPTFTIGGYFEDEHLNQKSDSGGSLSRVRPSRNTQAFYSQLLLAWQEQLFVASGFRIDASSIYGTHLTPRFSIAYILPRLQTKLRAGYGEGLKAPSFVQNFGTGSPFVIGNPNLKPEESESWEVGLDQPLLLSPLTLDLSLTYFSAEYQNLVAFTFGTSPNYLNVQQARSRGLEVGLRASLNDSLSVRGAYTYLETKVLQAGDSGGTVFVNGESLLRRPEHTGSFSLNYARERLNANLTFQLKGHSVDRDFHTNSSGQRVRLSGYGRVDLALSYRLFENQWGLRSLTVEGKARNLFDEDYEEVFGFSTAGATFLVGFRAEF